MNDLAILHECSKRVETYLLPVTRKLRTKYSDKAQSADLIKPLKLTIEKLRNDSDFYHARQYGVTEGLVSKLNIMEPKLFTPKNFSE